MTILEKLELDKPVIVSRYAGGETAPALAKCYNCSESSIYTKLHEWRVPSNRIVIPTEHQEEMCRRLLTGESAGDVAKAFGCSKSAVCRYGKRRGIDISARKKRHPSKAADFSAEIRELYCGARLSAAETSRRLALSPRMVLKFLSENGLKDSTRHHVHRVNHDFFRKIDSQESAYVLGLLMADGSVSAERKTIRLGLIDRDHIEKVRAIIQYEGPVGVAHHKSPCMKDPKPVYFISVSSSRMYDDLVRLGCVPRKTYCATFPDESRVPPELHRHLVRGWFDGDGCVHRSKRGYWEWGICGTQHAVTGLAEAVRRGTGVSLNVRRYGTRCPHLFVCQCCKQGAVAMTLRWLYEGSSISLERKSKKVMDCLGANFPECGG